jgi:cell division protein FtsQ
MRPLIVHGRDRVGAPRKRARKNSAVSRERQPAWINALPGSGWRKWAGAALAVVVMVSAMLIAGSSEFRNGADVWSRSQFSAAVESFGRASGLNVASIEVIGRASTAPDLLAEAVGVTAGDAILAIDLDAIRLRVEALPLVKSVSVRRQLPDTLRIEIEERVPFATWQRDGKIALIDREGVILADPVPADRAATLSRLPRIVGQGAVAAAAELFEFVGRDAELNRRLASATWIRARRWDLEFDNGVLVRLPEQDPASAWARLVDHQRREQILDRDIQAVDLRFNDRVVVRLTPQAAKARRAPGENT